MMQSDLVAQMLRRDGHQVELVTVVTDGDRRPIDLSPGVGVFVTALEKALVEGIVDLAVHSAKDVPLVLRDDLVIAARSKKPLLDAGEHNYRVVDPYYAFYGYGDPKITNTFGSEDLQTRNLVILVIHGAGAEAWRSATPKAKFVIINMPFKNVSVRRLQMRKKQVNAIFTEEADSTAVDSVVFWDGKQYKYQPLGMSGADN